MTGLEWLQEAGYRYLQTIQNDEAVFLNQVEVSRDEGLQLLREIGRYHSLPWADWAHACVAVAAVQVARDAEGDETSFRPLFFRELGISYSDRHWEDEFGKRIEFIIKQFFPDDYVGSGPNRYAT